MPESARIAQITRAASAVRAASALLVTAGAGMGVDSGMPDFRGPEGFWRAYPPYRSLGLRFEELANPRWFRLDPRLAWGFYGHRWNLYRSTQPHAGFSILKRWGEAKKHGAFVFTSNVDCHFQKAGFARDRLVECHGTLEYLQCIDDCGAGLFPAESLTIHVSAETFKAEGELPSCPKCKALARPNVLMFGDFGWDSSLTSHQEQNLEAWLSRVASEKGPLVIVELGAGTGVPTVRRMSESIASLPGATLLRINVREPNVPAGHTGIAEGALSALSAIDEQLAQDARAQ